MKLTCKAKNTLAFGERGIKFSLPMKGLTLVKGVHLTSNSKTGNGTGKSSLLNVVNWGNYGSIPKGRTKADMMNDVAESNCITDIEIENNGKVGRIIRTINADEYMVNEVPIVGDTLAFFIDGTDRRGSSDKETQVNITKFIGLDEDSFVASAWFTADSESFASKSPANQDKLFIKLLKLENLEMALKITKDMKTVVIGDILAVNTTIDKAESNLLEIEETKESLKNSAVIWKSRKAEKLERFDNKINDAEENIEENEEELEEADSKLVKLQLHVKDAAAFQEDIEEKIEKFNKQSNDFTDEIAILNTGIGGKLGLITEDKRKLREAQNLKGGSRCEHCNSELTEENLYKYRDELNESIESNEELEQGLKDKLDGVREKLARIKEKQASIISAKNDFRELQTKVRRWNDKKQSLESSLNNKKANLRELKEDREELEQTKPPQSQETSQLEKRIETLTKQVEGYKSDREDLLVEQERLDFWIVGFSSKGIRNLLIRSAIPRLNQLANKFSKVLTNNELTIQFSGTKVVGKGKKESLRNKMNIIASDVTGSEKYCTSSAGERRRIDICVDLALHFLVAERTNLPFVFMDEIFSAVDQRGKELILRLLRGLTEEIPSIILISNQEDVASEEFDNIWTVYREGKQSYLVTE